MNNSYELQAKGTDEEGYEWWYTLRRFPYQDNDFKDAKDKVFDAQYDYEGYTVRVVLTKSEVIWENEV